MDKSGAATKMDGGETKQVTLQEQQMVAHNSKRQPLAATTDLQVGFPATRPQQRLVQQMLVFLQPSGTVRAPANEPMNPITPVPLLLCFLWVHSGHLCQHCPFLEYVVLL